MSESANGLIPGEDGQPRCWWHGNDPALSGLSRQRMGSARSPSTARSSRSSRSKASRPASPGSPSCGNARISVAHSPISRSTRRPLRADGRRAPASGRRHRPAPGQDRGGDRERRRALDLQAEAGSLAAFVWSFEPSPASRPRRLDRATLGSLAQTPESKALSKALKQRGWRFVGPTTCYAFMQAMGLVNDHLDGCCIRASVEAERTAFTRPRAIAEFD